MYSYYLVKTLCCNIQRLVNLTAVLYIDKSKLTAVLYSGLVITYNCIIQRLIKTHSCNIQRLIKLTAALYRISQVSLQHYPVEY
jgi:hypothetical protein